MLIMSQLTIVSFLYSHWLVVLFSLFSSMSHSRLQAQQSGSFPFCYHGNSSSGQIKCGFCIIRSHPLLMQPSSPIPFITPLLNRLNEVIKHKVKCFPIQELKVSCPITRIHSQIYKGCPHQRLLGSKLIRWICFYRINQSASDIQICPNTEAAAQNTKHLKIQKSIQCGQTLSPDNREASCNFPTTLALQLHK